MNGWQMWGPTFLAVLAIGAIWTERSVESAIFLTGAVVVAVMRR